MTLLILSTVRDSASMPSFRWQRWLWDQLLAQHEAFELCVRNTRLVA